MGSTMFDLEWMSSAKGREMFRLHKELIRESNRWIFWKMMPLPPLWHPSYLKYLWTIKKWRGHVWDIISDVAKDMKKNPAKFEGDETAIPTLVSLIFALWL